MPPNRRNKVNRLPKSERREATSKVIVLSPQHTQSAQPHHGQYTPSTTKSTIVDTPIPSSKITQLPNLPDEIWLNILGHLPTDDILTCNKLSNQFQRIAQITLTTKPAFRYVNFTLFFNTMKGRYPVLSTFSHWSRFIMLDALQTIPKLESLNISYTPFQEYEHARDRILFPECVELVCSTYASPLLQNVVMCGIQVTFPIVQSLLTHCPNIHTLNLSSHPSVNRELCTKLANLGKQFLLQTNNSERRLKSLIIQDTVHVTEMSIQNLILSCLSQSIAIKSLPRVEVLRVKRTQPSPHDTFAFAVQDLTAQKCMHLSFLIFQRHGRMNDPHVINLSQCKALRKVFFTTSCDVQDNGFGHRPRDVKKLNLSGCAALSEVVVRSDWRINSDDETVPDMNAMESTFANLEELNLYGARSLRASTFAQTFGLCTDGTIAMPRLKILNLNGASIERVVLNGYQYLTTVDLSGSALQELSVSMCESLLSVSVLGVRMGLRRVDVVVPLTCEVVWSQDGWQWEQYGTRKAYTYP